MKTICVFCGSSSGSNREYLVSARKLGHFFAHNKISLVYGGASVGLMGAVADSILAEGGRVIGVLPGFLQEKEIAHKKLSQLIVCNSMHERKQKMFELSDGFIALPGGFGTLEEILEMLTWQQLGLHKKPIGFLNVQGFFNNLKQLFNHMENEKLLKPENKQMALFAETIPELLDLMKKYRAPATSKWIS